MISISWRAVTLMSVFAVAVALAFGIAPQAVAGVSVKVVLGRSRASRRAHAGATTSLLELR